MTDWRHHRTGRLWLDVPEPGDAEDLYAIHSDPATWVHLPSGRIGRGRGGALYVRPQVRRWNR